MVGLSGSVTRHLRPSHIAQMVDSPALARLRSTLTSEHGLPDARARRFLERLVMHALDDFGDGYHAEMGRRLDRLLAIRGRITDVLDSVLQAGRLPEGHTPSSVSRLFDDLQGAMDDIKSPSRYLDEDGHTYDPSIVSEARRDADLAEVPGARPSEVPTPEQALLDVEAARSRTPSPMEPPDAPLPRRAHDLDENQIDSIRRIVVAIDAFDIPWERLGLRGANDIYRFLGEFEDVNQGILMLEQRVTYGAGIMGHVEEATRGAPGRRQTELASSVPVAAGTRPRGRGPARLSGMVGDDPAARQRLFNNMLQGMIREIEHAQELTGDARSMVPEARTRLSGRRRSELRDGLIDGSVSLTDFARELLPPEGARHVELPVPDDPSNPTRFTTREVDYMRLEGGHVLLRESKSGPDLGSIDTQLPRDLWLLDRHVEAVVEWRLDAEPSAHAKARLRDAMLRYPGRFFVQPLSRIQVGAP